MKEKKLAWAIKQKKKKKKEREIRLALPDSRIQVYIIKAV